MKNNLPESISLLDRALCHKRNAIVVLRTSLPDSMPVDSDLHTLHVVFNVYDHFVVFADLDGRSRQHSVCCEDASLHSVG